MINKSSFDIININTPNKLIEVRQSKLIKDKLSLGLFAKKDIKKGTNIVIYFGDILDEKELIEKYKKNKNIMKYIRKGYDFLVDGSEAYKIKNNNLFGVYVNDIYKLKSTKYDDMVYYNRTKKICNVEVVNTLDFPIYIAKKDIKKNQELFVHYGLAYWLNEIGVTPNELKNKYKKVIDYIDSELVL